MDGGRSPGLWFLGVVAVCCALFYVTNGAPVAASAYYTKHQPTGSGLTGDWAAPSGTAPTSLNGCAMKCLAVNGTGFAWEAASSADKCLLYTAGGSTNKNSDGAGIEVWELKA